MQSKPGTYDNDPLGVLDVTVSSDLILDEILGIKDLRTDKRIDFVGVSGLKNCRRRGQWNGYRPLPCFYEAID